MERDNQADEDEKQRHSAAFVVISKTEINFRKEVKGNYV